MGGGALGGWGALIQRGTQWADRGADWATSMMARSRYASQVRHLRRREYQDMMFSMKEAGLNPILAAGGTPGHSAAMMAGGNPSAGPGVDVSGAITKGMSAEAAERQAGAAERGVRVHEVKTPYEVQNMVMDAHQKAQDIGYTSASTAKTLAETNLAFEQSGEAAMRKALLQRQAEKEGASAAKLREELFNVGGDPRNWFGRMMNSARGMSENTWSGLGEGLYNALPSSPNKTVNPNAGKPGVGYRGR